MFEWKPGDDYAIRLSDETAEERSKEELDEMVERMKLIANEYDFDLSIWGSWKGIRSIAMNEQRILDHYDDMPS
jgi:hypothetical protein